MALKKVSNKNRTINNIKSVDSDNNIVLINTKDDYNIINEYYFTGGSNKEVNRFIKAVKILIRRSPEYKKYIRTLALKYKLNKDVLMANIDDNKVDLEYHHYPFTLNDIVEIVLEHHLDNNINTTSISLAEDIMKLHFENIIGVARLTKTNHELVHQGGLYVPLTSVFGDVNEFINRFYNYIPDEMIKKYNQLVEIQEKDNYDNRNIFKKYNKN